MLDKESIASDVGQRKVILAAELLNELTFTLLKHTLFTPPVCGPKEMEREIRAHCEEHGAVYFMIYENDNVVPSGCISAMPTKGGSIFEVSNVFVRPLARRNGYCTQMLQCVEKHAIERGCSALVLDTDREGCAAAFACYQRFGFRLQRARCGNRLVKMRKMLQGATEMIDAEGLPVMELFLSTKGTMFTLQEIQHRLSGNNVTRATCEALVGETRELDGVVWSVTKQRRRRGSVGCPTEYGLVQQHSCEESDNESMMEGNDSHGDSDPDYPAVGGRPTYRNVSTRASAPMDCISRETTPVMSPQ